MNTPPAPIIAIYFTDPLAEDYPFTEEEYREAYHILAGLLAERGVRVAIVRAQESYLGGMRFSHGWLYDGATFRETKEHVEADWIFNRGRFRPDPGVGMINAIALNDFCDDKSQAYARFSAISPLSVTVENAQELTQALAHIPSELIVSKPLDGLGGEGIIIGTRSETTKRITSFPFIVQEFIDTSAGIPGICRGMHDFRMVSIDGEIVSVFIREPCEGSYLANVSKGASIFELPVARIPAGARDLFETVDRHLRHYAHRIYSVDVARGKDGRWTLIELNAQPGLSSYDYNGKNDPDGKGEGSKRYFQGIANMLAASV